MLRRCGFSFASKKTASQRASKKAPRAAPAAVTETTNVYAPAISNDGNFVVLPSVASTHEKKAVSASLPVAWLMDNCLSRRHHSGQRTTNLFNERDNTNFEAFKQFPKIKSASVVAPATPTKTPGGAPPAASAATASPIEQNLEVTFSNGNKATIPIATIEAYYFNKNYPQQMHVPPPLTDVAKIHRVAYEPFVEHLQLSVPAPLRDAELFKRGTAQHYAALKHLALDGILLVNGCGKGEDAVTTLAAACGSFVMPTLYGSEWHVASAPQEGSKNIAYTSAHLDLHQDLAYHESMPGIQLLHCQKFKESVVGGNTFFVDSFAVAEAFREQYPKEFDVFTKVPVAFIKDDFDRPLPAQYYYATPHIHLNDRGEINKVFWAPSFEAPIPVDGKLCQDYYKARAIFCDLLHDMSEKNRLSLRLGEGDCVIWQQVRVWHGREAFTEREPQSRVFHGAYANIDQFRCNVVAKGVLHNDPNTPTLLNFMNRSFR